ncbi:hypothetical protein [Pseudarthrobacter sp. NIBRBAC000502770]|uniref:hypothetical protein n=1 Tax=Pseudarthrobacter sp. NIBRBAC000502770 TaxID=2590785 RepID=UPI0011408372|nr:hypothetical protein [Pseudarthrobacter sp. NIBRBAC000502770]QDG89045.1 hypothetical protein NIBR502770_11565 [Pseudarthrobacter sp. NIBRBAC000502770]
MRHPAPTPTGWDAVTLSITNPAQVETELASAVDTLLPTALSRKCGLMVLRHGPGQYTAQVTQDVPFGLTREQTLWDRADGTVPSRGEALLEPAGNATAYPESRTTGTAP